MSSWDYTDMSSTCNMSVLYPSNTTDMQEVTHDFDVDLTVECGNTCVKVGHIKRTMKLETVVDHKWDNITCHMNEFSSDSEGSTPLFQMSPGDIIGLIAGSSYQEKWVDRNYWYNNPKEKFKAYFRSSWDGTYSEEFEYDLPEIKFIDPERGLLFWTSTHYKVTGFFQSTSPMAWTAYMTGEGTKILWEDRVGFKDIKFKVQKITTDKLFINNNLNEEMYGQGETTGEIYELDKTTSEFEDKYDIPSILTYEGWWLKDWYNVQTGDAYAGDGKGDGYYWSLPRWLFQDDTSKKYKLSWIDDLMARLMNQKDGEVELKEWLNYFSPSQTGTFTFNPQLLGSFCVSKLDSNPNEGEQTRHLLYSCQTQNGHKTQIAKLSKEVTRLEFKDLIDYLTTDQKEHIPCYPICPI